MVQDKRNCTNLGYAAKPKDYKKNPDDDYKGHVGHVSTVIDLLVGRAQSPDVWQYADCMMVKARINRMDRRGEINNHLSNGCRNGEVDMADRSN